MHINVYSHKSSISLAYSKTAAANSAITTLMLAYYRVILANTLAYLLSYKKQFI